MFLKYISGYEVRRKQDVWNSGNLIEATELCNSAKLRQSGLLVEMQ